MAYRSASTKRGKRALKPAREERAPTPSAQAGTLSDAIDLQRCARAPTARWRRGTGPLRPALAVRAAERARMEQAFRPVNCPPVTGGGPGEAGYRTTQ